MLNRKIDAQLIKTRESYVSKLKGMGIKTMGDLLTYFPRTYRDEQNFTKINDIQAGELNVISGTVKSIVNTRTRTGKAMTRATVADDTGEVSVMWFNQAHIKQIFFKGSPIILTGKLKVERGRFMMMSPKYERPSGELLHTGRIVPVYPESEVITSQWLRKKIHAFLAYADYFVDPMPQWILEAENLISLQEAIKWIHFPEKEEQLKRARERLAFDELFKLQFIALRKKHQWQQSFDTEESKKIDLELEPFLAALPFELTGAQKRVIGEIQADFQKNHPMTRLVQGDVGAGKTVVAAAAIYMLKQSGMQSALMAPTEILARQHYKNLVKLLTAFEMNVQLLTGSLSKGERDEVVRQLATGTCDLVVGTHALIQKDVQFANLGLAVVDEQHRFGVKQRNEFKRFERPHLLSLSATPIPRTLALTIYGDQDISVLDELPPGRQSIITRLVPEMKREDAYIWSSDQIRKGRQIFVICPLVEDSENLEVKSAMEEFLRLKEGSFREYEVALLHGRMKSTEKEEVMKAFSAGQVDVLVSTAVVEVGIDVPNATIMIIEGSERFGLAQLHQFRGRVGRGKHQSYCFLFTDSNSSDARERLQNMVKYDSGFDLAEMDLQMRGPGEVYGVKQSGIPDLKMASLGDTMMVTRVRERAEQLLQEDADLGQYEALKVEIEQILLEKENSDMV